MLSIKVKLYNNLKNRNNYLLYISGPGNSTALHLTFNAITVYTTIH